jgi:hypothetical protein
MRNLNKYEKRVCLDCGREYDGNSSVNRRYGECKCGRSWELPVEVKIDMKSVLEDFEQTCRILNINLQRALKLRRKEKETKEIK